MIELDRISRVYEIGARPVHALRDVTLRFDAGAYAAVMGPSGSGKSTLLNVIGCLDRPTSGTYRLDGRDVSGLGEVELSRVRREQIGFVFQQFHLVPRLSALANVELPMVFAGVSPAERRRRARRMLELVGLGERADHRPAELSGGQMQRVAIARAAVMEPRVLLADEPTGNLDSVAGAEVLALLETMNRRGILLLVVTHDPAIGARARRLIRLRDGEVVEDHQQPGGARAT